MRPVKVHSDDGYALREYMMTEQELARFTKRMDKEIARDYKAGTSKGTAATWKQTLLIDLSKRFRTRTR